MKNILITGARGFIGGALAEELVGQGYKVKALVRSGRDCSQLKALGVQLIEGDLLDRDSLLAATKDVAGVFHLAALYREAKFPDSMYWQVNFEATKNLLEICKSNNVLRFMHCSTTGVLGHIEHPPAGVDYPYGPLDVYQESKTEAEKLVLDWFRSGKIQGSVIRPTMVWGPRDTRLFKLFKGVASQRMPIIGSGKIQCHWVLVSDVAKAFRLAYESPQANAKLYYAAGERPVTLEYTMKKIAEIYGVSLLPFKIPAWPFQLAGSIVEKLCQPLGIEPFIHRRRVDFFVKNRAFDYSQTVADLGYAPSYNFEDEVKLTAKWYLDNGWITLKKAAASYGLTHESNT